MFFIAAINAQLTLVDITPAFLSAIMAVFSDDDEYLPGLKTNAVEEYIGPVSRLYCSDLEPLIAAGLIRLVQGDATTIQKSIGEKMGWSKNERNTVAALVLCSQRTFGETKSYMQSKTLDFRPSEGKSKTLFVVKTLLLSCIIPVVLVDLVFSVFN